MAHLNCATTRSSVVGAVDDHPYISSGSLPKVETDRGQLLGFNLGLKISHTCAAASSPPPAPTAPFYCQLPKTYIKNWLCSGAAAAGAAAYLYLVMLRLSLIFFFLFHACRDLLATVRPTAVDKSEIYPLKRMAGSWLKSCKVFVWLMGNAGTQWKHAAIIRNSTGEECE